MQHKYEVVVYAVPFQALRFIKIPDLTPDAYWEIRQTLYDAYAKEHLALFIVVEKLYDHSPEIPARRLSMIQFSEDNNFFSEPEESNFNHKHAYHLWH